MLAVVTSCTPSHFPGLLLLAESLLPYELPLVCIDLGLTGKQRARALAWGARLIPGPVFTARDDALWYKPEAIALAGKGGVTRAIWIDADAAVLRDPAPLLDRLETGPVFTYDFPMAQASCNPRSLYELAPVAEPWVVINAGVIALDLARDRALLDCWRWACRTRVTWPEFAARVRLHDQGALAWAIGKLGLKHRVCFESRFNQTAHYHSNRTKRPRRNPHYPRAAMLECLRADHPGVIIVHYMGPWKWWLNHAEP